MRELKGEHTFRLQQDREPGNEIVELRHVREHVVADDQVGADAALRQLYGRFAAEEADLRRNARGHRRAGDVGGRLDAQYRDAQRLEVLEQITVVAGDLDHLAR